MITENKLIKITDEEYFAATDYINSSKLKTLYKETSLHLTIPQSESKDKSFGSAAHTYILEPKLFPAKYYIDPKYLEGSVIHGLPTLRKLTKKSKPEDKFIDGSKFDGQKLDGKTLEHKLFSSIVAEGNPGKIPVKEDDYASIQKMRQNVYDTGMYNKYLQGGQAEMAIFTTITVNGVNYKVKVKLDYIINGDNTITVVDYKTCASAGKVDCLNSIKKWCYDIQAAFYRRVVWQVFQKDVRWIWAFAEKNAPHQTTFFEMPEWMLTEGGWKVSIALDKYTKTVDKGVYTGYDESYEVGTFDKPGWW